MNLEKEKKAKRKWSKTKQITIKINETKFDIKINWNQMVMDEIEKKI